MARKPNATFPTDVERRDAWLAFDALLGQLRSDAWFVWARYCDGEPLLSLEALRRLEAVADDLGALFEALLEGDAIPSTEGL